MDLPEPITRTEQYLYAIATGSGGGGGGDFSTATLTFVNNSRSAFPISVSCVIAKDEYGYEEDTTDAFVYANDNRTTEYSVILYKGMCRLSIWGEGISCGISGDISYVGISPSTGGMLYSITGDCTVTATDL